LYHAQSRDKISVGRCDDANVEPIANGEPNDVDCHFDVHTLLDRWRCRPIWRISQQLRPNHGAG
jgi:hypothetical protein